jgi:hypothetical protein
LDSLASPEDTRRQLRKKQSAPSEFRGEADYALKIVAASTCLPRSVRFLAGAVRDELPIPAAH